jgi:hypothetical protein
MPQRISARGRCVPCPAETARLHDSSRKSDSLRRLTLHRPVPATAKPSRLDARPRRSEYNLSWPVYDGRRTEYERQPVTYEATLPAAIRLLIFTSATGKVTSCPEGTTMRSGETAMAILRMTLRDPPDTMEPRQLTSGDLPSTARPGGGTTDRGRSTSYSSIIAIVPIRTTISVCGGPRALRQVVRQW